MPKATRPSGIHRGGVNEKVQESAGGPRGGSGAPVSQAMWADGIGLRAWAKALTGSKPKTTTGGDAMTWAHKGQSMPPEEVLLSSALPASSDITIFMPPMAEQTTWVAWGLTKGEATETPMNKANHTSTRRVIRCALRRVCNVDMVLIIP